MSEGSNSMRIGRRRVSVLCLLLAASFFAGCSLITQPEVKLEGDPLLAFGNPSGASTTDPNNYLLRKSSFILSYNNGRGTANWVSWRTTPADLGASIQRPDFAPDESLPGWFTKIFPTDYSGSGYDRGHMVPSADRFGDPAANTETFLMTNIVPQTKDLNQFVWERLERYERSIVRRGSDVYVIAGVAGEQGRIRGKVTIPARCWKIIVVLPPGSNEINTDIRVIAVDIPNTGGIGADNWRKYLTTVRLIEQRTGYDFLSAVPPEVQEQLETRIDERSRLDRDE